MSPRKGCTMKDSTMRRLQIGCLAGAALLASTLPMLDHAAVADKTVMPAEWARACTAEIEGRLDALATGGENEDSALVPAPKHGVLFSQCLRNGVAQTMYDFGVGPVPPEEGCFSYVVTAQYEDEVVTSPYSSLLAFSPMSGGRALVTECAA
jgi:hypothetical protein